MKTAAIVGGAIVLIAIFVGLSVMGTYNGLVTGNQAVNAQWAQVQTQYQRRFDLVPNLVAATKGILTQEQAVFGAIATARTHYASAAPNSNDQVQAAGQYDSAISRLLVVMENYPQLKSYDTVQNLTDEFAGTENRIAVSRDRYNEAVLTWNTKVSTFPSSIFAGIFGFHTRAFFEAATGSDQAPKVDLTI